MQDAFHLALKKRMDDVAKGTSERIATGVPSKWEDYREQVGYLRALRDVEEMCEQIEKSFYDNPLRGAA